MAAIWLHVVIGLLRLVAFIYDVIVYIPFYFVYNPQRRLDVSNRTKAKRTDPNDTNSPYRAVESFDQLLTSPFPNCISLNDFLNQAVENFGSNPCLGTRELLSEEDEVQPNGKIFRKAIFGDYKWLTYNELNERVTNFGRGLLSLGLKPKENICVFAETRAEWMITALACFRFRFPVITLYSTLGDEAVAYGINESEVSFVVTSAELLPKFKSLVSSVPRLQHIVYIDQMGKKAAVEGFPASVSVHTMSSVESVGAKAQGHGAVTNPQPDDIAVIMYTSGSTGMPKGVMITHGNILSAIAGQASRVPNFGPHDVYIGYLPLAHILELDAELVCIGYGAAIGYSTPNTLTDKSSRIKKGTKGDASVLRPTLMAAVPVIMDRISKGVWDKMNEGGQLQRAVFKFIYQYKKRRYESGYETPILDKLIFAKPRALLGGRIRLILSGGAPLSPDSQRFINICFCCPVGQGYGLTETTGGGTIHEVTDRSTGRVGAPIGCCEIRLVDWEEGGYKTTDQPHPRGEVWISGGNIALGYYKNLTQTAADFHTVNGKRWFSTGDIGQFHSDGCLEIIDRKKDLVKLQGGEYIALGKIETIIKLCPLVDNVCAYASGIRSYAICIVLPNQRHLKALAEKLGISYKEWRHLCNNPEIKKEYLKAIEEECVKARLQKTEIPQRLVLCREPWTAESGLVTESLKLKRKAIEAFYAPDIEAMYK